VADGAHRDCCLAEGLAVAELEAGTVSRQALADLTAAVHISTELTRVGIGVEAAPALVAAARLLRELAPGTVALTGADLAALRHALDAVEQLRRLATRGEFAAAVLATTEAQQQGRRL
jgi:hypothetical protein